MSIEVVRNGEILEVTINRPKANAIDATTSREMSAVVRDFFQQAGI
jgi:crotonobetainyl-CoA hydratase